MKLACVGCGTPIANDSGVCATCGRPTDADGDGVPDALDQLIEKKAKGILASERAAEAKVLEAKVADEALASATKAREQKALDERLARDNELRACEERAAVLASFIARDSALLAGKGSALFVDTVKRSKLIAAVASLAVTIAMHFVVFPLLTYSPAGYVVCPLECATCTGPGRVLVWTSRTRAAYALVCHNAVIDADTVTSAQIHGSSRDGLEPVLVGGTMSFLVEGLLLGAVITLIIGVRRTRKRRRELGESVTGYERERARGQARLAELQTATAHAAAASDATGS